MGKGDITLISMNHMLTQNTCILKVSNYDTMLQNRCLTPYKSSTYGNMFLNSIVSKLTSFDSGGLFFRRNITSFSSSIYSYDSEQNLFRRSHPSSVLGLGNMIGPMLLIYPLTLVINLTVFSVFSWILRSFPVSWAVLFFPILTFSFGR